MILETPDSVLKIHLVNYQQNIYPWIQNNLFTPYWRFYWTPVEGGCLKLKDEIIEQTPEYFYIVPGYLEFSTFARQPFAQFYIHFNPHERIRRQERIFKLPVGNLITGRVRQYLTGSDSPENIQWRSFAGISLLTACLLKLPEEIFQLPPPLDPRLEKLCKWLEFNRNRPVSNEEMATRLHLERNSFIRLFSAQLGEPPQIYFRRKRIELACELLHFSKLSIEEVAAAAGFADRYHFTRVFSRIQRTSPAAFRRAGTES